MTRIASYLVGIAALGVIATVTEARDNCGRGWFFNGRACVEEEGRGYRQPRDSGPVLQLNIGGGRDESRYSPPNPKFKTFNNCPQGYTVQDGLCKPYRGR